MRESLQRLCEVDDTLGTAMSLDTLAWISHDDGQPEWAATLLGVTARLARDMGRSLTTPRIRPDGGTRPSRIAALFPDCHILWPAVTGQRLFG